MGHTPSAADPLPRTPSGVLVLLRLCFILNFLCSLWGSGDDVEPAESTLPTLSVFRAWSLALSGGVDNTPFRVGRFRWGLLPWEWWAEFLSGSMGKGERGSMPFLGVPGLEMVR